MLNAVEKLWQLPDAAMHAHLSALQILGAAREAVSAGGASWPALLEIFESLAMGTLMDGVQALAAALAAGGIAELPWDAWRSTPEANRGGSRPVSAAVSTLHHRICALMSRYHRLTEMARTRCKVLLSDAHDMYAPCLRCALAAELPLTRDVLRSIGEAFFQQLSLLPSSIALLLDAVARDSSQELASHERGGALFTVRQAPGGLGLDASAQGGAGGGRAQSSGADAPAHLFCQPMDSPVKALSLLATCTYLEEHVVGHLTQLHLPLLAGEGDGDKARCMARAHEVRCARSVRGGGW